MAGKGWVAPRRPSRRPPRISMCMRRANASTVSFDYNCATVRRPRVYIKLLLYVCMLPLTQCTSATAPAHECTDHSNSNARAFDLTRESVVSTVVHEFDCTPTHSPPRGHPALRVLRRALRLHHQSSRPS